MTLKALVLSICYDNITRLLASKQQQIKQHATIRKIDVCESTN